MIEDKSIQNCSKKEYVSWLNVISSFAVVVLHMNGVFWIFSYDRYWITANIIECVMYFAVPVFFMISGATLLDYTKRYSTRAYVKKRVRKTFIPFLAWSLVGAMWLVITDRMDVWNVISVHLVEKIFNTQIFSIYWFFIPLFSVYLSIPLLSSVAEEKRNSMFLYTILVTFLFNSFFPFVCSLIKLEYNMGMNIPIASGYIIFVLLGYYIDRNEFSCKTRVIVYIAGIVGLFIYIVGTHILSYEQCGINEMFKGYLNVPSILWSVCVFLAFKQIQQKQIVSKFLSKITKPFQGTTFGIYLVHWFLIDILQKTEINQMSIWYRTIGAIMVFVICAILVKILQKISILSRILPS